MDHPCIMLMIAGTNCMSRQDISMNHLNFCVPLSSDYCDAADDSNDDNETTIDRRSHLLRTFYVLNTILNDLYNTLYLLLTKPHSMSIL